MLIQKIKTLRHEVSLESGLLVLDKTTFINDIIDYELEFETKNYETGLIAFEKLLEENNIDKNPAKPKIARAVEYSKR
jgi:adenylate cyclase